MQRDNSLSFNSDVHVPVETMCPHRPVRDEMPLSHSTYQSYFCNRLLGQVPTLPTTVGCSRSSKDSP